MNKKIFISLGLTTFLLSSCIDGEEKRGYDLTFSSVCYKDGTDDSGKTYNCIFTPIIENQETGNILKDSLQDSISSTDFEYTWTFKDIDNARKKEVIKNVTNLPVHVTYTNVYNLTKDKYVSVSIDSSNHKYSDTEEVGDYNLNVINWSFTGIKYKKINIPNIGETYALQPIGENLNDPNNHLSVSCKFKNLEKDKKYYLLGKVHEPDYSSLSIYVNQKLYNYNGQIYFGQPSKNGKGIITALNDNQKITNGKVSCAITDSNDNIIKVDTLNFSNI